MGPENAERVFFLVFAMDHVGGPSQTKTKKKRNRKRKKNVFVRQRPGGENEKKTIHWAARRPAKTEKKRTSLRTADERKRTKNADENDKKTVPKSTGRKRKKKNAHRVFTAHKGDAEYENIVT